MRARTVIGELRRRHRVIVYAYGDALSLLRRAFRHDEVEIRSIPGLGFAYDARGRLDYPRTLMAALPFVRSLARRSARLAGELDRLGADLAITDFEPLVSRAAKRSGVPVVSLDHQHLLRRAPLEGFPPSLRLKIRLQQPFVRAFVSGQSHTIISSFAFPPSMPQSSDLTTAGVLLSAALRRATVEAGEQLLVYLRRHPPRGLVPALAKLGVPTRVYGLGARSPQGRLSFHAVGEPFLEDLARCRALVTTAGNQLVGEALYLRKPVLALPEAGNFEQALNAWLLHQSGLGEAHGAPSIDAPRVSRFLDRAESWRARIDPRRHDGTATVLSALDRCLGASAPPVGRLVGSGSAA
jgi:uncharacterized protein (TIGR00661 family)